MDGWIELLKFFSSVSTAAFGLFGIGSPKARHKDGSLTTHGKVALYGLLVALAIALASQLAELLRTTHEARAEAARYEGLLRASLYGSLSTRDALLDFVVEIPIAGLDELDHAYVHRLRQALDHLRVCRIKGAKENGSEISYSCEGYSGTKYAVPGFKTSERVVFRQASPLLPDARTEGLARLLFDNVTVSLFVGDIDELRSDEDAVQFTMKDYQNQVWYIFDGDSLMIEVKNAALGPTELPSRNLSSMVDFAGRTITLITGPPLPPDCSDDTYGSKTCDVFFRVFTRGVEVREFAIRFPHRRDLVYGQGSRGLPFKEGKPDPDSNIRFFTYKFPDSVENFPIADRRDR